MGAPRRSLHDDIGSYPESPFRESTSPTSLNPPFFRQFRRERPMRRVKRRTDEPSRNSLSGSVDLSGKRTPDQFDNNNNKNNSSMQTQKNGTMNGQPNANQNPNPFFQCPQCFVRDNDPHVNYMGAWTLDGTQSMTQHSTTLSGSSISLKFNGSGIIVFGTVPTSNTTNPPPTAVYALDNKPFETTLPFAISDVQNQPLFASMGGLSNEEHHIVVNVTAATTVPYIFESFFVFPEMGSDKDVIGQIPTSVNVFPTDTAISSPTTSISTPSLQSASPDASHTAYDPQKIIRILASFLGTLIFLILGAIIAYAIVRRRLAKKQRDTKEKTEKGRPDTIYTSFTSTESIMRYDSGVWSPFRSPRSQHSRSEGRAGQVSTQSTSLRTSTIDNVLHPPPLPPKPALLLPSPIPR